MAHVPQELRLHSQLGRLNRQASWGMIRGRHSDIFHFHVAM
jgi:hypothetical protein